MGAGPMVPEEEEEVLPNHLGRARLYPHIRECTLPLCVLAVVCTMRNEVLRSIA